MPTMECSTFKNKIKNIPSYLLNVKLCKWKLTMTYELYLLNVIGISASMNILQNFLNKSSPFHFSRKKADDNSTKNLNKVEDYSSGKFNTVHYKRHIWKRKVETNYKAKAS